MFCILALLLGLSTQTALVGDYTNNCLSCIRYGHDFCSEGTVNDTVSPDSGYCCSGMTSSIDSCYENYDACTYDDDLEDATTYFKYLSCSASTSCKT